MRAAIIGISGLELTPQEIDLLRDMPPLGIILFSRNVGDPGQLRALTAQIRDVLGVDTPILVDQEGGRVARLRPPHWPHFAAAATFEQGEEVACRAHAQRLGATCADVGIDVVCAPVLDLRLPEAHGVIGDRAFSAQPMEISRLGAAMVRGLQAAGTIPVVKHIPGHGRAMADSHLELPRVDASEMELQQDIAPFQDLSGSGTWAMTAHILYRAWDTVQPATLSPIVIERVIRGAIGFDGFLVSDDLAMKALSGAPADLAQRAIGAGCDAVLHCTGVYEESAALLAGCPVVTERALNRMMVARLATDNARQAAAAEA